LSIEMNLTGCKEKQAHPDSDMHLLTVESASSYPVLPWITVFRIWLAVGLPIEEKQEIQY